MTDARLVPAALIAWLTTAWLLAASPTWILATIVASLVASCLGRRFPRVGLIGVVVMLVALGVGLRAVSVDQHIEKLAHDRRSLSIEAIATTDARSFTRHGHETKILDVVVRRASSRGTSWTTRTPAVLMVPSALVADTALTVGTRLTARTTTRLDDGELVLSARSIAVSEASRWWWRASERVRSSLRASVDHWDVRGAGLVPALVAGDESGVDEQLKLDFRRSGLTHLLAVSGTNLTIVLGLVLVVIRRLGARRLRLLASLLTTVAFVLVARPEPSVLRAAVMGTVAVVGFGRGRRAGLRALSVTVVVLLVVSPALARTPGFVLSVCATGGILVLGPPLSTRLARWLPSWAASAVAVPLAAHVACLPAVTALSDEVSIVAVFANILAAPAVAPATVLGLSGGLLALVWTPLGQLVATPAIAAAEGIVLVGTYAAGFAGAALPWSAPWWLMVPTSALVAVASFLVVGRPVLTLGLCLGLVTVIIRPPHPGWPPDGTALVSCDVGQGAATVIPVGPGAAIVVDVGLDDVAIDRCLTGLGVERIVLLAFTHGDADHVAAWRAAVGGRRVDHVMIGPGGGPDDGEFPGATLVRAVPGDVWRWGDVEVRVVWPPPEASRWSSNDASIVLRVAAGGFTALLTGDLGAEAQRRLVGFARSRDVDLASTVMTMPHHGSADVWPRLFDAAPPTMVTISAGRDNSYGHPAQAALELLAERGIRAWRTDVSGDIAVIVDGSGATHVGTR